MLAGLAGLCLWAVAFAQDRQEGGPKVVRPYSSFSNALKFKGGERALVIASSQAGTDIDLYVYDEAGNLIAWDDAPLDACALEWLAERTATYAVEVRNTGPSMDAVEIVVR
jgi:hypothetical protein